MSCDKASLNAFNSFNFNVVVLFDIKVNEAVDLEKIKPSSKQECKNQFGYTASDQGEGLRSQVYDNIIWKGDYQELEFDKVDQVWLNSSPIPDKINRYNFGIKFFGGIRKPTFRKYKFRILTDGGAILQIGNKVFIEHKMKID